MAEASLSNFVAQTALEQLSIRIARQRRRRKSDRLRYLVIGQVDRAVGAYRIGVEIAGRGMQNGVDTFSQDRTRRAYDCGFDYTRQLHQHVFHFGRVDLVAAAIDHVFLAIEDAHEILCVIRSDIA